MENIFNEIFKGLPSKAALIAVILVASAYFVIIKPLWDMTQKTYNLNDKAGVTTLQQDAEEGYGNAQYWLGKAYYYGEGLVEKNEEKGLDLLRQAKKKGFGKARNLLGCIRIIKDIIGLTPPSEEKAACETPPSEEKE